MTSANKSVNHDDFSTATNLQKHKLVKENQTGMEMKTMVTSKTWPYGKNMQGGGKNTEEILINRRNVSFRVEQLKHDVWIKNDKYECNAYIYTAGMEIQWARGVMTHRRTKSQEE